MTKKEAQKTLSIARKCGYVPYYNGLVTFEENGKITSWGANIDGDGRDGRLFGCPQVIWNEDNGFLTGEIKPIGSEK